MKNSLTICVAVCLVVGWGAVALETLAAPSVPETGASTRQPSDEEVMERILRGLDTVLAQPETGAKPEPPTNNGRLGKFLEELIGQRYSGGDGQWQFQVADVEVLMVTDERADRMRIMAPVANAVDLDATELRTLLEADFDRALDAKYAIWRGAVWAVFVHPLSSLTRVEFHGAVAQVFTLTQTYGASFSSTEFVFGGGAEEPTEEEGQPPEDERPGPDELEDPPARNGGQRDR